MIALTCFQTLAIYLLWERVDRLEASLVRYKRSPVSSSPSSTPTRAEAPDEPATARAIIFEGQEYDTFRVKVSRDDIVFAYKDAAGTRLASINRLREYLDSRGLKLTFATNAGMFKPDGVPLGLYVEDGNQITPLNTKTGDGNFFLKSNGVFAITDRGAFILPTSVYQAFSRTERIRSATQSGPLLVLNGRINAILKPDSKNTNIRSGVGILSHDEVFFAISKSPVTFYEFAHFFATELKCSDALYLDGAISKMYLPAIGRDESDGDFGAMVAVVKR